MSSWRLVQSVRSVAGTFRFRVVAFSLAVVLGVSATLMVGMRTALHITLQRDLDVLLASDLDEIIPYLDTQTLVPSTQQQFDWQRRAKDHRLLGWFVRIVGSDGKETWASESTPEVRPSLNYIVDNFGRDWQDWRVMHRHLAFPANTSETHRAYVEVGASLGFIDQDIARLDRVLFALGAAIFILLPLLGWWAAAGIMAPLDQLTAATDQLQPTNIDRRLLLRGTGDNLDQLAGTINSLLDRVQGYLSQREDWLANSAHELRSPIAAISSCVQVVLANLPEQSESSELLEHVLEECHYLGSLVNQLLLLSEVDADRLKVRLEPVRWSDIVKQACQIYEPLANSREIDMAVETIDDCSVRGNASHLRQVIHNLLGNSIQYTQGAGKITVRLKSDPTKRVCLLQVADTGKGISREDLPRVTERFYRGDSSREPSLNPRGTGLGLSICKTVVEAHDGELRLKSELGKGTTVEIELPLAD